MGQLSLISFYSRFARALKAGQVSRQICLAVACGFVLAVTVLPKPAHSWDISATGTVRVATWHSPFTRRGPGLLLRDLASSKDAETETALAHLTGLQADILLLTAFDYDADGLALRRLQARLKDAGLTL